jgi:anti-sigma regulatory factor (Ser/Thr protein kinase)
VERELVIASTHLVPGLDALEAALRGERVPDEAVLELRLVAEEVLTNAAKYGHDDGAEHPIRLRLTLVAGEATLEFRDDGRPFDPLAAEPPDLEVPVHQRPLGGFGIRLMLALVDDARYLRDGSQNVLTLRKRVSRGGADVP